MYQSQLFTKTSREAPKDEQSVSAQLLMQAGFIDKLSAGIYTFLPLGLRVLRKIENIIREEIDAIGGQEILMPALTPKENWQKTGRWETFEALFKTKGADEKEYALGATHEEIITPLVQKFVFSYKDLPCYVYQIQTKFRNELRAKSGLIRCREFSMKDLYSFHTDEKDLDNYYEKAKAAYFKTFKRCGLGEKTYLTLASGGTFSKYSHEFQALCPAGEDMIFICQKCNLAINKEIKDENPKCPECSNEKFKEEKSIEVGNIFKLMTKYSAPFDFKFRGKDGHEKPVVMGCYGLGPGRIIGAAVETGNDEKGIIWHKEIAPFDFHLLTVGEDKKTCPERSRRIKKEAENLYQKLRSKNCEILFDDREISAGEKFNDADLIGIPYRLVISEKTLAKKSVEIKARNESKSRLVKLSNLTAIIKLK